MVLGILLAILVGGILLVRVGWFLVDVVFDHTDPHGGYFDHFDKYQRWHTDVNDIRPEDMTPLTREARRGSWRLRRSRRKTWHEDWH